MKISSSKENLVYGTQIAQRCISSRAPLPILNGILLTARDHQLTFQATDLDLAIECATGVEVLEEGSVVVPARHFLEIVRRLPDQTIHLESDPQTKLLILTYGSAQFSINTLNPDEFPVFPNINGNFTQEIKQVLLKEIIRQVAFAASNDPIRPLFTGVMLEIAPHHLLFVATDTHRLAKRKIEQENPEIEQPVQTIIPARALNELYRLLKDEDLPIKISITDTHITFYTEDFIFSTRPIQGYYPDYKKVLPEDYQCKILINTTELLPAIERASLLISTKEGNSIVHLTIKENYLTVQSNSVDLGSVHEEIPATREGQEIAIAFNARYLIDALKNMEAEQMAIEFTGNLGPGIIRPISEQDYLYLLLPIRT